jgi:DNA-binding IclR family transcriptional regulator
MQGRGYLYEIAPRAGYYPTLRLQALGKVIADNDPVVARADLLLRSLRDTLDETVLLAKVNGLSATYLLAFEATHPLRFMISVGENVRSLHATSAGKALLGSLEERDLSAFLKTAKLTAFTDRTITTAAALRANLDLSRQRGWFLNHGESLQGVTTLSARFRWNTAVYVVTVAGPALRIDARLDQAAGLLTNVCQLLEMRQHDPAGERR